MDPVRSTPKAAPKQWHPCRDLSTRRRRGAHLGTEQPSARGEAPALGHAQITEFAHRGAWRRLTPSQPRAHARSRLLICYRLSHSVRKMSTAF